MIVAAAASPAARFVSIATASVAAMAFTVSTGRLQLR
jgi:hypothetical protein